MEEARQHSAVKPGLGLLRVRRESDQRRWQRLRLARAIARVTTGTCPARSQMSTGCLLSRAFRGCETAKRSNNKRHPGGAPMPIAAFILTAWCWDPYLYRAAGDCAVSPTASRPSASRRIRWRRWRRSCRTRAAIIFSWWRRWRIGLAYPETEVSDCLHGLRPWLRDRRAGYGGPSPCRGKSSSSRRCRPWWLLWPRFWL